MTKRFFSKMFVFSFISIISLVSLIVAAQNPTGPSLVQTVAEGKLDKIQSMIAGGANINEQNPLGWTPLHAAVNFGYKEIVQFLIQSHAIVNPQDSSGKTPLYMAVESGQAEMVKILIDAKADLNISANNGQNALSLAQIIGQSSIAATLKENNAAMPVPQTFVNPEDPFANRRGRGGDPQNGQMPVNRGSRRGPRGNGMNPDLGNPVIEPGVENPDQPVSIDTAALQPEAADANIITLDPNEVKERMQKFEGLEKAVQTVASSSRIGMRQWQMTDTDNKARLITAERSQIEDELAFIKKIAEEEKAKKTSEAADKLLSALKERYIIAAREVKNQADTQAKQTRGTTTSSRRSARGTTGTTGTTRSTRRGTTSAAAGDATTGTTAAGTQKKETTYKPEVQSEIDTWMNADVISINGRLNLMNTVYDKTISEIDSLKKIAVEEKAEKTIAAIDGLIVARQERYDAAGKELEKLAQQQGTTGMPNEMPGTIGVGSPMPETTTGRARRGR